MAAHAVLEVTDAFVEMPRLNDRRIVLVAAVARVFLEVRRRVARLACDSAVPAVIQREGMIELRALPALRSMTLRAVGAEGAQVLPRLGMTTDARLRCALEDAVDVTLRAGHIGVRACQLERRQIVIELGVLPARRSVALRAIGAEGALMVIILLMTIDAAG